MNRRVYLDWLRGLAVVIMIEAHTLDSWTRLDDRPSLYGWAMVLAGYGAPYFMFLAGVALALAAGGRQRKGLADADAVRRASQRGWQVLGIAYLFRLQSWLVSGGSFASVLKVDILNVMGPSMVAAAVLWGTMRRRVAKVAILAAAAVACTMLTPLVRSAEWVNALPTALGAFLRPIPGRTTFTFFPWSGFLLAGAAVGAWLEASQSQAEERRTTALIGVLGAALAVGGYAASYLPSIYAQSEFWTSSPTYFFVRLGLVMVSVPLAYAWTTAWNASSPLLDFGRSSLFVYLVHVEIVYGGLTHPIHRALSFRTAIVSFVVFTVFMLLLTRAKERMVAYWEAGPDPQSAPWSAAGKGA